TAAALHCGANVQVPEDPLSTPFPSANRNLPEGSSFWIRLLFESATQMLPAASVATPAGRAKASPATPVSPAAQLAATVQTVVLPPEPLGFTFRPMTRLNAPSVACAGAASASSSPIAK